MAIKIQNNTVIDDNKLFFPSNTVDTRAIANISSNTLTINLNSASIFETLLDDDITTVTINNVQSAGSVSSFVLVLTADGTPRSISWPASFRWPLGEAPTVTSLNGKKDTFIFFTTDGGSIWQALICGQEI